MPEEITRLKHLGKTKDALSIDPRIIVIEDGHNPRNFALPENRAHLEELKESIREHGVLQPLWVRFDAANKRAVLVDGETRLRATLELIAEGAEIDTVPAIGVTASNEADRLILALTANTGKPLSAWETGVSYKKLLGWGWTPEKIAKRMGQTLHFVNKAVQLSDAPEELKQLLSKKAITPALASQLMKSHGDDAAKVAKQRGASEETPLKRDKQSSFADLKAAARVILGVADQQPDAMVIEIHRDDINALRAAMGEK